MNNLAFRKYRVVQHLFICLSFFIFSNVSANSSETNALVEIPSVIKSSLHSPNIEAKSWVLANYDMGWIVAEHNADLQIEPASLTKLMTAYLVFESIKNGTVQLDDMVHISKKAWKTGGSKMFIEVGSKVSVEDLIQGLVVQSGNDAAVALAEYVAGTEQAFADRMNDKAKQLGMINTNFVNSSGLPDKKHYTTARDMTILAMTLIREFPKFFKFYSQAEFTYNNITQYNRNALLKRDDSVDGLKTGYTKSAGYCLIGTAERDQVRYIATVIGADSKQARADQVSRLLEYGYRAYTEKVIFQANQTVTQIPLYMGQSDLAGVAVEKQLSVIYPRGQADKLSTAFKLSNSFDAPLKIGQPLGEIEILYQDTPVLTQPLYAAADYPEGAFWSRIIDGFRKFMHSLW